MQQDEEDESSTTLSYGKWSKGLVNWKDFEDVTSAPSSSTTHGKAPAQDDDEDDDDYEEDNGGNDEDFDDGE